MDDAEFSDRMTRIDRPSDVAYRGPCRCDRADKDHEGCGDRAKRAHHRYEWYSENLKVRREQVFRGARAACLSGMLVYDVRADGRAIADPARRRNSPELSHAVERPRVLHAISRKTFPSLIAARDAPAGVAQGGACLIEFPTLDPDFACLRDAEIMGHVAHEMGARHVHERRLADERAIRQRDDHRRRVKKRTKRADPR